MCFARPAPRCSKHALIEVTAAADAVAEARLTAAQVFTLGNLDALHRAEARAERAADDYRVSLAGIRDLHSSGKEAEAEQAEVDRAVLIRQFLTEQPSFREAVTLPVKQE